MVGYDDAQAHAIAEEFGWNDPPESGPMAQAAKVGAHIKFMGVPIFEPAAWCSGRIWSVDPGTGTPLLAKSFAGLERLYHVARRRLASSRSKWTPYYQQMHSRRYKRWLCHRADNLGCSEWCSPPKTGKRHCRYGY